MAVKILETERTILRELTETDAEFMLDLLNQPSFIKYIGDRGVRTLEVAAEFVTTRYQKSYRENGFGLYGVELKSQIQNPKSKTQNPLMGICGFVRRVELPFPDIGFAFLPQYEKQGYAFETASAVMRYGKETLGLKRVLAITTQDNAASVRLLEKLGFGFEKLVKMPSDEKELNLFAKDL